MLVYTLIITLGIGISTSPVYAEADNSAHVAQYIESVLDKKPKPSWDQRIAPQLAKAAAQRKQEEERIAREAAEAAEAQRVAEEAAQQEAQQAQIAVVAAKSQPPQPVDTSDAKMFIYMHESGNNPAAINASSGACGLGQALPCSKMPCSLSDYGCQDQFFTSYMLGRYGSWENARAFWLAHSWW